VIVELRNLNAFATFLREAIKTENNLENLYNHNFDGLYCYCNGSYDEETMIMYQCVMCYDWFHIDCIKGLEPESFVPNDEVPCDFICFNCTQKNPFLLSYAQFQMDETKINNVQPKEPRDEDYNSSFCKLKHQTLKPKYSKTFFFEKGWRDELCTCNECLETYKKNQVEFLLTENDDEEELGEEEENSQTVSLFETSQSAFLESNLPHNSKINLLQGYNSFYSDLKEYLKSFAESGKEVTKQDIDRFSEEVRKKRRKLE